MCYSEDISVFLFFSPLFLSFFSAIAFPFFFFIIYMKKLLVRMNWESGAVLSVLQHSPIGQIVIPYKSSFLKVSIISLFLFLGLDFELLPFGCKALKFQFLRFAKLS